MGILCLTNSRGFRRSGGTAQNAPGKKVHPQSHLAGIAPAHRNLAFWPAACMLGHFKKLGCEERAL